MLNIPIKEMELSTHTSLFVTGCMNFMWDDIGKMLSSSSITTHALHDAIDSKNLSLNLAAAWVWDSVRNLSWTSCWHRKNQTQKSNSARMGHGAGGRRFFILNRQHVYPKKYYRNYQVPYLIECVWVKEKWNAERINEPWPLYRGSWARTASGAAGLSNHHPQLSQWSVQEG